MKSPDRMPAAVALVADRQREPGLKALRQAFGGELVEAALDMPGRWLAGLMGPAGRALTTVDSEDELLSVCSELHGLRLDSHVELYCFLEAPLFQRVQDQALLLSPAQGRA